MGRWSWSNRHTVEQCLRLGIDDLGRFGLLKSQPEFPQIVQWTDAAGKEKGKLVCRFESLGSEHTSLRLSYTVTSSVGEKKDLSYRIDLTTTPCNFGGFRFWFICPLEKNGLACGERVSKLYLPPGGIYFGCRRCYDLTYRSCQEHDSRVSALLKLPPHQLVKVLESKNPGKSLLGIKAYFKLLDKLEKRKKN